MKPLPEFKSQSRGNVVRFLTQAFTHPNDPDTTYFHQLVEYDDGHYAAVFNLDYFADTDIPTKSQWNSLKKKLKRHDKRVFVFKEQRVIPCENGDAPSRCGEIEFGFFAH